MNCPRCHEEYQPSETVGAPAVVCAYCGYELPRYVEVHDDGAGGALATLVCRKHGAFQVALDRREMPLGEHPPVLCPECGGRDAPDEVTR